MRSRGEAVMQLSLRHRITSSLASCRPARGAALGLQYVLEHGTESRGAHLASRDIGIDAVHDHQIASWNHDDVMSAGAARGVGAARHGHAGEVNVLVRYPPHV